MAYSKKGVASPPTEKESPPKAFLKPVKTLANIPQNRRQSDKGRGAPGTKDIFLNSTSNSCLSAYQHKCLLPLHPCHQPGQ